MRVEIDNFKAEDIKVLNFSLQKVVRSGVPSKEEVGFIMGMLTKFAEIYDTAKRGKFDTVTLKLNLREVNSVWTCLKFLLDNKMFRSVERRTLAAKITFIFANYLDTALDYMKEEDAKDKKPSLNLIENT